VTLADLGIEMEDILDTVCCLITDRDGRIVYISDFYAKGAGVSTDVIGKYVYDVLYSTRMHIVSKTGIPEVGVPYRLSNGEMIVISRLPIIKNGEVLGVLCYKLFNTSVITTAVTTDMISRLNQELSHYKCDLSKLRGARYSIDQIKSISPSMQKIKESLYNISQTRSTVLISGATGTGKELVAHAIHQLSPRSHQPFVQLNCSAIPAELFESELFGYEEGAFTGAKKGGKLGKLALADKGTIVFDEIQQLPMSLQPKLLRVLQERQIERVGGKGPIDIDVKMIFITNRNLAELVAKGEFRDDLYYRINIVPIEVPPLRERMEDLPILTDHIIKKINNNLGLMITGVDMEVMKLLALHSWPGNVRELEHTLERAANVALTGNLTIKHFSFLNKLVGFGNTENLESNKLIIAKEDAEKQKILQALSHTRGNISWACEVLNTPRSVLYKKLKKYNIDVKSIKKKTSCDQGS
jgi:transcriptional regulator with PAS, ATPase and Fis domain